MVFGLSLSWIRVGGFINLVGKVVVVVEVEDRLLPPLMVLLHYSANSHLIAIVILSFYESLKHGHYEEFVIHSLTSRIISLVVKVKFEMAVFLSFLG